MDIDGGFFGQINYQISGGNEAQIFSIEETSGEISVARPSRLTTSSLYQFNVTAIDGGGFKSICDAHVQISTTSSKNVVSCGRPRYSLKIKEDIAQNSLIGRIGGPSISSPTGE